MKNNDVKLYTGCVYDLSRVLDTGEKYEAYILESGYGSKFYADLGRQRYLYLEGTAYLVLVSARAVKLFKLRADENDLHDGRPVVRMRDVFARRGIKCRMIADYMKGTYSFGTAWERSLRASMGVFSKYGFATQYYFWNDCNEYEFEIRFVKRGHILIDGQDIMSIRVFHSSENVMKQAGEYVRLALTGPAEMSISGFEDRMKQIGLEGELRSIYFNLPGGLM